ncbi:hypothetical protein WAF17_09625 [Bernardetia sp. ABR2-2B]|uniref:hypothetical protein n=1 Tax=Bernardetia sp. ABR2-2B TaxID=3127472 RepID=UPI0030CC1EA1
MNSLKKKFGKFAVSRKEADNVTGGFIDIDPWDDGGSGGWGGTVYHCSANNGDTLTTSSVQRAGRWCQEREQYGATCSS